MLIVFVCVSERERERERDSSSPLFHHPSLLLSLIKGRLLELPPGHLPSHALSLVQGKDFGWAVNVFPCHSWEASVYVRAVRPLLKLQVAESAQPALRWSFWQLPFLLLCCSSFPGGVKFFLEEWSFRKVPELHPGVGEPSAA